MPLIDEQTVNSLRRPDGSFSQFALYLLCAVPQTWSASIDPKGRVNQCANPLPVPHADWERRVLCTKISRVHLRCIRYEAKRIKRMKPSCGSSEVVTEPMRVRRQGRERAQCAGSSPFLPAASKSLVLLRALKRKLNTLHKHEQALIDRTMEKIITA